MKQEYFNPFPGLRSFEEDEEYLFFGREKQIDELVRKLGKTKFLAVVGASGSGKSSLVKSGLLPSLHSGFMEGVGSGWRICTFRPGNDPIGNLSLALSSPEIIGDNENSHSSAAIFESILRRNDKGVSEGLKQLSENHTQNILIVVDQFEELFRFSKYEKAEHKGTRDSVTFINLLIAASKSTIIPIYVVFTMRSDFLGDCTEFRGLPEAINEGQYLIPRMTREERKAAILGPITVGGANISQSLLARLLNDVGDNPDQLPILQHALMRTWEYWCNNSKSDDVIDLWHYEAIGTMSKALSLHAEEAFFEIKDEKGQEICKKIFQSLTDKIDGGRGTRRPSQVKEICELAEINISEVASVIDVFRISGRSFLMPPIEIELSENTVIDISHESLMRVWERLISWVNEEIESAEIYTRLAQSAALYQEGKTGVWRDPELQMAMNWKVNQNPNKIWAKRYDSSFDRVINFLEYSQSEKNREIQGTEKKRKAAILRLRIFISIITVAFCLAVYFGISSYQNEKKAKISETKALIKKREADRSNRLAIIERDNADREQIKASQEKDKAEISSLYANEQKKIAEAALIQVKTSLLTAENATQRAKDSALVATIQRKDAVNSANVAKVETQKAVSSKREVDRLRLLAETKNMAIKSSQLASDPNKDTLSLQLAFLSYAINRRLGGPMQNRVIYDALKNQLTSYYTKIIRSRKDIKLPGSYDERDLVFRSNNQFITAGDEGVLKIWEISGNPIEIKAISSSKKNSENYSNIAISFDNKLVIAGSTIGTIFLWDPAKANSILMPIFKSDGKCMGIYFIPSKEDYSLVCVFEKSAHLISLDKSNFKLIKEQKLYTPENSFINTSTCFTKDGTTFVFISEGKTLKKFTIGNNGNYLSPIKIVDFSENISALSVCKDGRFICIGGSYGAVKVYRLFGTSYIFNTQVSGNVSAITGLNFSSNDSLIVTGSLDHSMRVKRLFKKDDDEEDLVFKEKDVWIRNLCLSPDNKYVVSVGQSGLIQVWPVTLEYALNEIKGIKKYKDYLNGSLNETGLKIEIGDKLFESLWKMDSDIKNFKELWEVLKTNYLN
jgi:WD40 repeat protein